MPELDYETAHFYPKYGHGNLILLIIVIGTIFVGLVISGFIVYLMRRGREKNK